MTYVNGKQEGCARSWDEKGGLREETRYRDNVLHGSHVVYDEAGILRSEERYEYGILLSRAERNEDGEVSSVFTLGEADPQWRTLASFRRKFGWPPPAVE
ncbi:toxin-antitoxin system YwqK family antitoxin [Streptomyces sp. NPDC059378]|uniref:toxin-antitoxin system YwqK family antitoxin n=1 Tax=Streptomyces sp. NPDC059378 TaxID=3346815 RepID=UPI00368722D7